MATLKDYKYYIAGRYIGILAYDSDDGVYLTPTEDDDSAIMLRYTLNAGSVSVETDSIDIDDSLARALVYYVKKRLSEDIGDEQRAVINTSRFYHYVNASQNNKLGTGRMIIPQGVGVLK